MAYATISNRFYLKKEASPNHRGFPIYCRISCQRNKAELYTGENCMPDKWNEAAGAPLRDLRLKDYLSHVEETIRQQKRQLEMEGREVSAKILKDIFRGKGPAEAETDQHQQQVHARLEQVLNWLRRLSGWSELLTAVLLVFLEMYAHVMQLERNRPKRETVQQNGQKDLSANYLKQRARQCTTGRTHRGGISE